MSEIDLQQHIKGKMGHTAELLSALSKFVQKFGVYETTSLLRELSDFRIATPTQLKNIVVGLVCAELQMKPSEMFGQNNYAGKRVEGLRMTAYLLIRHARLSQKEVSDLLNKDKSAISKYLQDIKNLDSNWKADKESLDTLARLERYFKTIIQLKNPNGDNNTTQASSRTTTQDSTSRGAGRDDNSQGGINES